MTLRMSLTLIFHVDTEHEERKLHQEDENLHPPFPCASLASLAPARLYTQPALATLVKRFATVSKGNICHCTRRRRCSRRVVQNRTVRRDVVDVTSLSALDVVEINT